MRVKMRHGRAAYAVASRYRTPLMPMLPPTQRCEPLLHRRLWFPGQLSGADLRSVFENAVALKRPDRDSASPRPLRGRHVALLCPEGDAASARLDAALTELGATVAQLNTASWCRPARGRLPDSANLLGKLYDAIDCGDLPPELIKQIDTHAGVPVFNGLCRPAHPACLLAGLLTMRGALGQPPSRVQVLIKGDPHSVLYREARRLLPLAGLGIQPRAPASAEFAPAAPAAEPDFIFHVSATVDCGRPEVLRSSPTEQLRIDTLHADNQRRVMQALFVSVLSGL